MTHVTVVLQFTAQDGSKSWVARDERGEIVETVDVADDAGPDWSNAGICDHRGPDHDSLVIAMDAAERNAIATGYELVRVPAP